MNLWAKRAGLLFSAAVLIFLISCEDDSYLLGFKGKTKFKGRYQELVFDGDKSSVLLLDSVFTDQFAVSASPVDPKAYRFLIGNYLDPDLGSVSAHFYAQFLPNDTPTPNYFNPDGENIGQIILDSTTIQLMLDYYAYGPEVTIDEVVNVYSLVENSRDSLNFYDRYINSTELEKEPALVGQLSIKKFSRKYSGSSKFRPIDLTPIRFELQTDLSEGSRDTIMLQGKLDEEFAFRIFNWIATKGDSALVSDSLINVFRKKFPGLAFFPTKTSRILGINPLNAFSRLTFHYHTPTRDSVTTALYFTPFPYVGANGFTNMTTTRSGGLSGITVPQERYIPSGIYADERYIQDGSGIVTELDLSDYYSFIDTLEDIVINSAEISMDVKAFTSGISPVPSLYGIIMKREGNTIVPLDSTVEEDFDKMKEFAGNVYTDLSNFGIATELSAASPFVLTYDNSSMRYRGFATLFFQRMFDNKDKPELNIEHIAFYPATAPILKLLYRNDNRGYPLLKSGIGNTVNRAVLKASGIKLKLYYTIPNKPNLE